MSTFPPAVFDNIREVGDRMDPSYLSLITRKQAYMLFDNCALDPSSFPNKPYRKGDLLKVWEYPWRVAMSGDLPRPGEKGYAAARTMIDYDMRRIIEAAQWFDFGDIDVEAVNKAAADAQPFMNENLIVLPYPACVFRMRVKPRATMRHPQERLLVLRQPSPSEPTDIYPLAVYGLHGELVRVSDILTAGKATEKGVSVRSYYNGREESEEEARLRAGGMYHIMCALWLIVNTRNINRHTDVPDEKLNRARIKRGQPPLEPVIRVDTNAYITALQATQELEREAAAAGDGTRTHRSPRMHLRRAHLRYYHRGEPNQRIVPIHAMIVNGHADMTAAARDHYKVVQS
jgi:hypothetical protein